MVTPTLMNKMDLPLDILPSAEEIRRAELKFACVREDGVKEYYEKMMNGEDLYMIGILKNLADNIADQAFRGNVDFEFKMNFSTERPHSPSPVHRNEIYMDTVIRYNDGTYHVFEDYLDAMTYLHSMCEFLFDYLESEEKGYEIFVPFPRPHVGPGRPGQPEESEPTREEKIRRAFATTHRENGFSLTILWGDDDFADAVNQMETMAQYDSYVSGVPLSDILA